jgi:DNA-binding transcriptional LysR family regulator
LRLTPAGTAFAASARVALAHLERGRRLVLGTADPGRGNVRLAAIGTAAELVVLPALSAFRSAHPDARLDVEVGNRARVWEALARLSVDLVVAGRPPLAADADTLGLADNSLVLVGRGPAPASSSEVAAVVASSTWLLREEGSGTREAAETLLTELGADGPRMILGSNGAVRAAVAAGLGIALLPHAAVAGRVASGRLCVLSCPGTPVERPWHLVASAAVPLNPTAALAARCLLAPGAGFTPTAAGRRLLGP